MKKTIILASQSPRRLELLKQCGLKFRVVPSHIEEKTKYKNPKNIVQDLALQKAFEVAQKVRNAYVIGADTIVVLKGKIIGKPDNEKHALKILKDLNGSYHTVYSGVAVVDAETKKYQVDYETSRVKMCRFTERELKKLCSKHLDKAGAYAVQEKDDKFVEKIEGDYYNVVGLPLKRLATLMKHFGLTLPRLKSFY